MAVLDERGASGRDGGYPRSTGSGSEGTRPEFDRQPPQDIPAEQSVLGAILLSKDAIADVVEMLKPDDFYRPAHQTVYECVLDLYGRGEPADPVTVSAELERRGELLRIGGAPYLHTLIAAVPTAANAAYYAEIVADRAILRRLVEAGTRIVQLGYHGGEGADTDDIVDRAQAAVYEVTDRRVTEDYVALEDVLQPTMDEIDAIASRGGVSFGVPTGFADLDEVTNGLHAGQMVIVAARPGIGKALALDTPLPTPEGWTTMGEVAVGDDLLDRSGRPTRVVAATEVMTGRPCYEVEFSDGTTIIADAAHQWTDRDARLPALSPYRARGAHDGGDRSDAAHADRRPAGQPLGRDLRAPELPAQDLPLPPYALGIWLGDGTSESATFTSADPEIAASIEAEGLVVPRFGALRYGLRLPDPATPAARSCVVCGAEFVPATAQVRTCGPSCGGRARSMSDPVPAPTCPECGGPSCGLRRCQECHRARGTVQGRLRSLGVFGDKHIPTAYLRASEAQRRALLAGLLDSDGTVLPTGVVQFAVTCERLARDTAELVASLGLRCSIATKAVPGRREDSRTAYLVTFSTTETVFRLERKRLAHKDRQRATSDVRTGSALHHRRSPGSVGARAMRRGGRTTSTSTWRAAPWCRPTTPPWDSTSRGPRASSTA